mgnify:CR=1 FL=1
MIKSFVTVLGMLLLFAALNDSVYAQYSFGLSEGQADSTGYIKPTVTDQDSFYVVLNHQFDQALHLASGDSIEVEPGSYHLQYVKQYYIDVQQRVRVEKNTVHSIGTRMLPVRGDENRSRRSSYPRLFWDSNNFVLSDPETDLYINGEYAGMHYITVDTTRSFEVTGIHPSGREFTSTFTPTRGKAFNFHQEFAKPRKKTAILLSFLPGGSQYYKQERLKAAAFTALTLAGAALAYSYEHRYQDQMETYNRLNGKYLATTNPEEAFLLGNKTEAALSEAVSVSKTRNRVLYGTALLYVVNIIDGLIPPSIGYRDQAKKIDPYLDFDPVYRQPVVGIQTNF